MSCRTYMKSEEGREGVETLVERDVKFGDSVSRPRKVLV